MKIALFGASGRTGKHVVEQALAAGHQVMVLGCASKFDNPNPNLRIIQGDLSDLHAVEKTIAGADSVLSVLAPSRDASTMPITHGMQNILKAMQQHGVKRLVVSTGAVVPDPNDARNFVSSLIKSLARTVSFNEYFDMYEMTNVVRASDRDWTIVRVPMLTDGPKTGKVSVAWVGKEMKGQITRADLADFMLKQVEDRTYLKQAPVIYNP